MPVQKKPLVYLLVIFPLLLAGVAVVLGLVTLYARMAGISQSSVPRLNGLLIGLPALFLWIPIALVLANCILYAVPPLRIIAETYVARAHRPGFVESQKALGKLVAGVAII